MLQPKEDCLDDDVCSSFTPPPPPPPTPTPFDIILWFDDDMLLRLADDFVFASDPELDHLSLPYTLPSSLPKSPDNLFVSATLLVLLLVHISATLSYRSIHRHTQVKTNMSKKTGKEINPKTNYKNPKILQQQDCKNERI